MMQYSSSFKPRPKNSEVAQTYLSVIPDNNRKSITNTNQPIKVPHPLQRKKRFTAELLLNLTNPSPLISINTAQKPSSLNLKVPHLSRKRTYYWKLTVQTNSASPTTLGK